MKKTNILFCFLLFAFCLLQMQTKAQPIYQLPNAGFETWYRETTSANSIVPTNFNSFYSASGGYATLAQGKRCDSSRDVRTGATGTFSLMLYSTEVLGIRANGNVTTGRINAGIATANHENNYNYTDYTTNAPKHLQEITGTPDSLRFWTKYLPGRNANPNTTDRGRIRVYIHGTGPCRDAPLYPTGMIETELYYGKAMKEFYKEDGGWHRYTVPFEYTGNNIQKNANGNYYVLVSMTTNATPGGGANNADYVWFDDIEFVYSAWLEDLAVNGETIENFNKHVLDYPGPVLTGTGPFAFPYLPEDITYLTESIWTRENVVVTNVPGPEGDADRGYTSILITAIDGSTKEYKIHYATNYSTNNSITGLSYTLDGETPIAIPGVNPATFNYQVTLTNPDESRIPNIRVEDVILADPTASVYSISQPTTVFNSQATIIVRAEDHSLSLPYTVNFSKPISSNEKLSWIKVAGTDIPDFHPDILEYYHDLTACVTTNTHFPAVTYGISSVWATVNYTAATTATRTATITVTAQNGDVKTYKVNFVLKNDNVSFTRFRFSAGNTHDITQVAGQTVYERSISFTAAQTITPTWNCTGVLVDRVPANTVYYPDTNYFHVTAQDGITKVTYKIVLKNTNCFLATGNNAALRYNYNGLLNQNTNINITTTNNNNLNPVTTSIVTTPPGPNVPAELVVWGLATTVAPPTWEIEQPESRTGTAKVTLTANDGVTQKVYNVPFNFTPSNVATLSDIKWNGNSISNFDPNNDYYTVSLDASVTEVPEVIGIPTFQWLPEGNIVVTPAEDLFGTTTIVVTAENGTTTKTYYVEFTVQSADNAFLSSLGYRIGGVNYYVPNFRPTIFEYNVDIAYTAPMPQLFGTPMSSGASLLPITTDDVGKMLVISENLQGMKIYTVNFNRVKNTNATLSDIKINGESLHNFRPEQFEYEHKLDYTTFDAPIVTATPAYEHSQVNITQINTVTGTVIIHVTAENDAFAEVYTIDFTRELSPINTIDSIFYVYNDALYMYQFFTHETEVTISLPVETVGTPSITAVIVTDGRSTFEIEEQPEEENNLTGIVIVTAEDTTEETYYFTFERTPSASTLLTGIYYDEFLVPNFNPATLTYTIMLPFAHSAIPNITATAAWQGTSVETQNPNHPFGTGTVTVTSEDGENMVTYTIIFQRKGSPYLLDLSYTLDGATFPIPNFHPQTYEYPITLPIGTTAVPVLEYVREDNRSEAEHIQQEESNGTSQIIVTTWNNDTTITYSVHFTVELSTEALLSDLQVDGVTIPGFNPNTFNYDFDIYPFGTEETPIVTATVLYPDATEVTTNINEFPGTATVVVTAGDISISSTYRVSFSVDLGNNTYLERILISGFPLQGFNEDTYFYKIPLAYGTTEFPEVTATPADPRSSVVILPETPDQYQSGDTINIFVTAINGDVAIYQVLYIVAGNNNAYAEMIYVDWKPIPDFESWKDNYTICLPENYLGEPLVQVKLVDPNAKDTMITFYNVPLQKWIKVTAENGEDTFTYLLTFEKCLSIDSFENERQVHVFPNPSSGIINFEIDHQIQEGVLEIYSIEGKKAATYRVSGGVNTINIESLQNSIYLYKIISNNTLLGVGRFLKN